MKARTPPISYKDVQKAVADELEVQKEAMFREIAAEIMAQCLANVFCVLDKQYGWKKKRLFDLIDAIKNWEEMMTTPTAMTHRFDALDNLEYLKKTYGIDIRSQFPATIEVRP